MKPNVRYRIYNSPSFDVILTQVNPALTFPQSLFKIHFNITLHTPKIFNWSPNSKTSYQRVWILV